MVAGGLKPALLQGQIFTINKLLQFLLIRRTGGWGDENSRVQTAKSVFREPVAEVDSDEEELPIIPDLEEVEQEDLALRVAEAPSVAVTRVATYKELDTDLFKHAAFATLEEIDLRLLTRCLAPEASLKVE